MVYSTRLGREIPETAEEMEAHLWLNGDDHAARASIAKALTRFPSSDLGKLLARVSAAEGSGDVVKDVSRYFGETVASAYAVASEEIVSARDVALLLREVSRDEILESAAQLLIDARHEEAFDVLIAMGRLDQREVEQFLSVVETLGGTSVEAAQWLAVKFAGSFRSPHQGVEAGRN